MAKLNGRLTAKAVSEWFSAMDFEAQRDMLDSRMARWLSEKVKAGEKADKA